MDYNPYSPPAAVITPPPLSPLDNAEAIRREHLTTETNLKAVGLLFYLGAFGLIIYALSLPTLSENSETTAEVFGMMSGVGGMGVIYAIIAKGMRRLKKWVRIPAMIFLGIGMLGFPIGTIINGYILYLLLGKKGKFVMTDEYHAIMTATPHIKYKTPKWLWIILLLLVLAIVLAIVLATTASS